MANNAKPRSEPESDVSMELELGDPPAEVMEYATARIGENLDTRAQQLQELRDLIYERGEAMPHRMDDTFLLRFLRSRNFNVERAHTLLVNYYDYKKEYPEMYEGVDLNDMRFIGEDGVISALPYREQTGRRLLVYKIGNWNPSKYSVDELFKATQALIELAILEARAQILGGVVIFDLGGLSLQHAWNVTPSVANRVLQLMGLSFPIKTHSIHIVNQSWMFEMIFGIFRPLLDERMREKIHFHGTDMESLHKFVDPKFLPEAYGGVRPEYSYTQWFDTLRANPKVIEELRSLGYKTEEVESTEAEEST